MTDHENESAEEPRESASPAPAPLPVQGREPIEEEERARVGDQTPTEEDDTSKDADSDPVEDADPKGWWKAFRTGSQLDIEVGRRILSPREAAFVVEYMKTPDHPKDAAIRAGYAVSSAQLQSHRLLHRERVQRAIAREMARKRAASEIDTTWIMQQLHAIATDERARYADRLKAVELAGRHLGAWQPEEVHHHHHGMAWADIAAAEDAEIIDDSPANALPDPDSGDQGTF